MRWFRRHDPLACQQFVELVTDYLEDALPRGEHRRFEAHIADCSACTAYLDEFRITVRSLADLPPEPPDPATREHLLAAFRELRGS